MPSGLKRDLGLPETFAIAVGAMIGSGIFVLPGVAWVFADAAAVIAFVFAAVLVLPAAMAVAEMSTAIPEDGGPYLYVERSMGPLLGTIAGVGTWLMLTLKSALALVGGVPYLLYVNDTLVEFVTVLAVALAILFTVINLVSAEGSGKLQFGLVGILVAILAVYVLGGFPSIDAARVDGAFNPAGAGIGLIEATAIVFISYAGLTKVGAVAEEVANPGRNLPLAIGLALGFVAITYALVVYVTIGILDIPAAIEGTSADLLSGDGEGAIIALAAEELFGGLGQEFALAIVVAALLALASTANAGILAASRFPLAMARDGIFPSKLEEISERFTTPVYAVALTGIILIGMVAVFPVQQVAAFGSAFQILVFIFLNIALIGFREGAIQDYDPAFETPLYPWMPIFGIVGGLVVLAFTGIVAVAGALGIGALAALWYFGYVRRMQGGIDREGSAQVAVRESIGGSIVEATRDRFERTGEYNVLVSITDQTGDDARQDMVTLATNLGRLRSRTVSVCEFVGVPDHLFPSQHQTTTSERPAWLSEAAFDLTPEDDPELKTSGGTQTAPTSDRQSRISYQRIESEDPEAAITDFVSFEGIDLLFIERQHDDGLRSLLSKSETARLLKNVACDVALVEDRGIETIDEIAVITTRGEYDPLKLLIADSLAEAVDAEINLVQAVQENRPETRRESVEKYHAELMSICESPVRSSVIETDQRVAGLTRFVGDADLLFTSTAGEDGQVIDRVDITAIAVQPREQRRRGLVERVLREYLF